MEYVYYFSNASLTLRVVEYLNSRRWLRVKFVTVIHDIDGWIIKIKLSRCLNYEQDRDFCAFLNELGFLHQPEIQLQMAMYALETGKSMLDVIARYQVAVVSHGSPDTGEIEEFCSQFLQDLGYFPQTLL